MHVDSEVETMEVKVRAIVQEGHDVCSFELVHPSSQPLPKFLPGAHVDVHMPDGGEMRQYSLCSDPDDPALYRIAVTRHEDGVCSRYLHENVKPGSSLRIGMPRNNFPLVESERYLFIAGGIGVTPFLPMIQSVERAGAAWQLHYSVRDLEQAPFIPWLREFGESKVKLYGGMQGARLFISDLFASASEAAERSVYCCGPQRMMSAVERAAAKYNGGPVYMESFLPTAPASGSKPFEVECAKSGKILTVPANKSILNVFDESGVRVRRSCRKGICRTCEVRVLAGEIDHLDSVLSPEERAAGNILMACVSRAKGDRIVVDL